MSSIINLNFSDYNEIDITFKSSNLDYRNSIMRLYKRFSHESMKLIELVVKVIKNPESYKAVEEGDLVLTTVQKIKGCLDQVKEQSIDFREQYELPTLNHLNGIRQLISNILLTNDRRSQENYYHLLVRLAKNDSTLESLLHEVRTLLSSHDKVKIKEAKARLLFYSKNSLKTLSFTLPMRPLVPKNPEAYQEILPQPDERGDDAVSRIKYIAIGHRAESYLHNLRAIAEKEDFQVIRPLKALLDEVEWLRDPLLFLDKKYLLPAKLNLKADLLPGGYPIESVMKKLYGNSPSFDGSRLGCVAGKTDLHNTLMHYMNASEALFYFEGGNIMKAKNSIGEEIYLVGANNVLFSILNSNYLFSPMNQKMLIIDWIKKNEHSPEMNKEYIEKVTKRLESAGFFRGFLEEEEMNSAAKIAIAAGKIIVERMEETFGKRVLIIGDVFERPVDYHLDMFMMPSFGGRIFIQSYTDCITLLKHILSTFSLTESERFIAENYLIEAEEKEMHFEQDLKQITKTLRAFNFDPISVPGVFHDDSGAVVVFLNGIIAQGKEGKFCITNGSSNAVDRYLREAFTLILNRYGIKNVYFTGRDTESETWKVPTALRTYSTAEESLAYNGGIHCRTLEVAPEQLQFLKDLTLMRNGGKVIEKINVLDNFPHFLIKTLELQLSSDRSSLNLLTR